MRGRAHTQFSQLPWGETPTSCGATAAAAAPARRRRRLAGAAERTRRRLCCAGIIVCRWMRLLVRSLVRISRSSIGCSSAFFFSLVECPCVATDIQIYLPSICKYSLSEYSNISPTPPSYLSMDIRLLKLLIMLVKKNTNHVLDMSPFYHSHQSLNPNLSPLCHQCFVYSPHSKTSTSLYFVVIHPNNMLSLTVFALVFCSYSGKFL